MPYSMRSQGSQHCVYNEETDKTVPGGCHPTRPEAMKHMQALEANVHKKPQHNSPEETISQHNSPEMDGGTPGIPNYIWSGR